MTNKENINMSDNNRIVLGQGLVIKPGDKVLITLSEDYTDPAVLKSIKHTLEDKFEGTEFFIIAGANVAVVEAEAHDTTCTCKTEDEGHYAKCPALKAGNVQWKMVPSFGGAKFYPVEV